MTPQPCGGRSVRQDPPAADVPAGAIVPSASGSAGTGGTPRVLLTDAEGAALYGMGVRGFLDLQREPWFPRPVMLGPRLKRHVRAELEAAIVHMPRQTTRSEPAQLLRGKIERLKRGGTPTTAQGVPRPLAGA